MLLQVGETILISLKLLRERCLIWEVSRAVVLNGSALTFAFGVALPD